MVLGVDSWALEEVPGGPIELKLSEELTQLILVSVR